MIRNRIVSPVSLGALMLFLAGAPAVHALQPETLAAIHGAATIGSVVKNGDLEPGAASTLVKSMRRDGVGNSGILDVFRAILGDRGVQGNSGMGAFVQHSLDQGLRGRALADAIHREQAVRGIRGQERNGDGLLVPVVIPANPPGNPHATTPPGHARNDRTTPAENAPGSPHTTSPPEYARDDDDPGRSRVTPPTSRGSSQRTTPSRGGRP
jgi:hypothetical protein